MRAMVVKIGFEIEQLAFEIGRCPEQRTIQALSAESADQSFHKWMGQRNIGYGLDFSHIQDSQVGLPLMKTVKRIVVGAEVLGHPGLPSNRAVEHSAKCDTVDGNGLDAEPHDAAGELIHNHQDPMSPQRGRFALEQIYAPEAVLQVAQKG